MLARQTLSLIAMMQCMSSGSSFRSRPPTPTQHLFVPDVTPFDDSNETDELGSAGSLKSRFSECCGPDGTWVTHTDMNAELRVWPEKKFAFCAIAKNAHTHFIHLMNHLNGVDAVRSPASEIWWEQSIWNNRNVSFSEITKANGWRFGVFLRDPAERFLSAWSSKCVQKSHGYWEDGGSNCLGGKRQLVDGQTTNLIAAFEHAATLLPEYMKTSGTTTPGHNMHWDPQALFCDLLPLADYDFIGHISGDSDALHSQVTQMFEHTAKVPREHPTFWQDVAYRFASNANTGWVEHNTNALTKMQTFYRSPETYELVTRAYDVDYKKLPMKHGHYSEIVH